MSASDSRSVELGVKFRADVDGKITALRFYKGWNNTGTHTGSVWTARGQNLATVTFTGETSSGWQQVDLPMPVSIAAGQTYVASYHAPNGRYSMTERYFTNRVVNGPLTALKSGDQGGNGVYAYGSSVKFPANTKRARNYWVDVVFEPSADQGPTLLFSSGFEANTSLSAPSGGHQKIVGTDNSTGYTWPISAWSGSSAIHLFAPSHQIELHGGAGRNGSRALYQRVNLTQDSQSQVPLIWFPGTPDQTDLYTSAWIKFQPDLATQLADGQLNGQWANWRSFFEWKTGDPTGTNAGNGDYRVILFVKKDAKGLFWEAQADNNANGSFAPMNSWGPIQNRAVAVPVGVWFHLETFTHRSSGSDGRFWAKVNGQTIVDRSGPNVGAGNKPINRVFLSQNYHNARVPSYQWVDDLEVWDGVPTSVAPTEATTN